MSSPDQTENVGNGTTAIDGARNDDFLARERAALGDDANQFTTGQDKTANLHNDDDDLLGGGADNFNGAPTGGEEILEFESSFPAVDTRNDVSFPLENMVLGIC